MTPTETQAGDIGSVQYSLVNTGEQQFITVFAPGKSPQVIDDSHPYFGEIRDCVTHGDCGTAVLDLIDLATAVSKKFQKLSERVGVQNGRVLFDGDPVDGTVETQIVKFLDQGRDDWQPLVRFMENVAANPTDHSRTQLYDWLRANNLAITDEGNIIGFKGVGAGPDYLSGHSGAATVTREGGDPENITGRIPNPVGAVVEMPRSKVQHDPSASCSTGLHVGNYQYAQGFSRGGLLEVHVNPRDVVSVPTDAGGDKVRVSRYTVVGAAQAKATYEGLDHDDDLYDED